MSPSSFQNVPEEHCEDLGIVTLQMRLQETKELTSIPERLLHRRKGIKVNTYYLIMDQTLF